MNLDFHDLKTNGGPALLRALKQIEAVLTQQETDITELQYLLSEELIARLAPRSPRLLTRQREVVAELGWGWRIERQPATPNASAATSAPLEETTVTPPHNDWVSDGSLGTPGYSWLADDWVTQYTADVEGSNT